MSLYENTKCPVCNEVFKEGDDIVTCPVCGTPHHRECYNKLGKCANASLHSEGFEFKRNSSTSENAVAKKEEKAPTNVFYNPMVDANKKEDSQDKKEENTTQPKIESNNKETCRSCGAEIEKGIPFCTKCGARQDEETYTSYKQEVNLYTPTINEKGEKVQNEKLDGIALKDFASFIRINTDKFLNRFKKHKKVSWNWSAFIFGPYYMFYRKMHLQGAMFMAINLIINIVVNTIFATPIENFYSVLMGAYQTNDPEKIAAIATSPEYMAVFPVILISLAGTFLVHLAVGLLADLIYRRKIVSTIKMIDDKFETIDMASFNQMLGDNSNVTREETRNMLIMRKGGVNAFAPMLAYLMLNMITTLISAL